MGAASLHATQLGAFSVNGAYLQPANISDDLDARDENNQPIVSQSAKDGLTEIFKSGLFNLLVTAELYTVANILNRLERQMKLASENLSRNIPATVKTLIDSFLPTTRQLEKIFAALCAVFGSILLSTFLKFSASLLPPTSMRISTVVLRC